MRLTAPLYALKPARGNNDWVVVQSFQDLVHPSSNPFVADVQCECSRSFYRGFPAQSASGVFKLCDASIYSPNTIPRRGLRNRARVPPAGLRSAKAEANGRLKPFCLQPVLHFLMARSSC